MPLERLIRPYQTRVNTPPVRIEQATHDDPQPITIRLGIGGSGKTLTGSFSSSLSVYMGKAAVESKTKSNLPSPPSEVSGGNFSGSV